MTKHRALWIVQVVLALVFLFAGGVKLVLPVEALTKQMPMLSGTFLRFVAVCEVLGGLGLILPMLLRIQPRLTALAAACLVVIMIGATTITLMIGGGAQALFPAVVGVLAAWIAYSRRSVAIA
jgi:hypothetical protein